MYLYGHIKGHKLCDQSMRDYLMEIYSTCDSLASCGHPVDKLQQVYTIFGGLASAPEYGNVVAFIHANLNNYNL